MTQPNIRIDTSAIAQAVIIATLLATIGTLLALKQEVILLREKMNNVILAKDYAIFKATTEQRLEQLEKKREAK